MPYLGLNKEALDTDGSGCSCRIFSSNPFHAWQISGCKFTTGCHMHPTKAFFICYNDILTLWGLTKYT